jgi:acyl-CoA synthetase (NDP forming)
MHPKLPHLLAPGAIAIVGANDKGNVGARAIRNALAAGFTGPLYPVNPNYQTIEGLDCYPSLGALPQVPDAVVVAVPVRAALDVLADADAAAIPAAVCFSEGFSDAGTEAGAERHRKLIAFARDSGMAISGPNSMGILSLKRGFAANFMNLPAGLKPGGLSIISQSGGLINALCELGRNRDIGFNYLISAGNEAVVNAADYLEWLAADDDTNAIIAIVEGVKDGAAFRRALAVATARKPVVLLKLGRSELGRSATLAHTGSLAGQDAAFRALATQCGAIMADTLDSALEIAACLGTAPLPDGNRVVIFSTSGGATVLTTDLGVAAGLNFPPLNEATNRALQDILEVARPFTNPFDVVGNPRIVKGDNMTRCLNALVADEGIDAIGFVLVMQRDPSAQRQKLLDQIAAVAATTSKPIMVLPEMTMHWRDAPPSAGVPISGNLSDGLAALRALVDYAAFRRRPPPETVAAPAPLTLSVKPGRNVLTEAESKAALGAIGLPVTRERLAASVEDAVTIAQEIGFPVALKVQAPALVHKTEAGGIALNLRDADAVRAGFDRLATAWPGDMDGILVQEMVRGGIEVFLGMHRDAALGPVIVLGPGGVHVDLFADAMTLRLPPFGPGDAEALLDQAPAVGKLLRGFRGAPAGDRTALIGLIDDFARFVTATGDGVAAIDLNPVMVLPDGEGAKVVDATIELAPAAKP